MKKKESEVVKEGNVVVVNKEVPKVSEQLSKEGKATIARVKKKLETIGKTSKDVCKDMATLKDSEIKFALKELGLSKQSISQMRKAGRLYMDLPCLDDMTHTNIVELAPLFDKPCISVETGLVETKEETLDNFTKTISTDVDKDKRLKELFKLSQKAIREAVKDYLGVDSGEGKGDGDGDGDGGNDVVTKSIKDTNALKDFWEVLEKYNVSKPDKEVIEGILERMMNEVIK
jgi:hypothetical protein